MEDPIHKELLDRETVRDLRGVFKADDSDALGSLIGDFLDASCQSIQSIEEATSESDWNEARQMAHRLKGMSSQLGARALREVAMELEEALRDEATSSTLDHITKLKRIYHQTIRAYDEIIDDGLGFETTNS